MAYGVECIFLIDEHVGQFLEHLLLEIYERTVRHTQARQEHNHLSVQAQHRCNIEQETSFIIQ